MSEPGQTTEGALARVTLLDASGKPICLPPEPQDRVRLVPRLARHAPAIIAVLASLVAIVSGIVALMPKARKADPFKTPAATETFSFPSDDPGATQAHFAPWLEQEARTVWTSRVDNEQGFLSWSNPTDSNAVHYLWIRRLPGYPGTSIGDLTDSPVSVDVKIPAHSSSTSSVGLIYRWNDESRRYYAFMIAADGSYKLLIRGEAGGLTSLFDGKSNAIRANGWNRIGLVGHSRSIDLYIAGQLVRSVDARELHEGVPGIIAVGTGSFEFDNFQTFKSGA